MIERMKNERIREIVKESETTTHPTAVGNGFEPEGNTRTVLRRGDLVLVRMHMIKCPRPIIGIEVLDG